MKQKVQSKHFAVYTLIACLSILLLICSVMNTHLVVMGVVETQHMAIDLGTSSMKVASLRSTQHYHKASTSMAEVILNDQSNRKSPSCVAFRPLPAYRITHEDENNQHNNTSAYSSSAFANLLERSFAESAEALQARFPEQVICSPTLLLDQSQSSSTSLLSTSSSSSSQFIDHTHEWNKHFPFTHLDQSFFVEQASSSSSSVQQDQHDEYNYPFFYKIALSSECNDNSSLRLAVHLPLPQLNSLGHEENNNKLSTPNSPAFASYEVEEVIAMLLQYAQRLAENADMHDSTLSAEEYVQLFDFTKSTSMQGNGQNSNKLNHAHNKNKDDVKEIAEIDNNAKRDKIKEIAIPPRHPIQSVTLTIPTNTPLHVIQRLHDAAEMAGFTSIDFKSNTMSAAITLAQLRPQLFTANKSEKSNKNSFLSSSNVVQDNYSEEEKEYEEFYKLYQDTHTSLQTDPKLYNESTFVMIYDMGYAHTEAAVFAFSPYKRLTSKDVNTETLSELKRVNDEAHGKVSAGHATRNNKKLKKYDVEEEEQQQQHEDAGVLELITSITNNKLGGRDFDLCIANYWDRTFLNNSVFNSTLITHNKHHHKDYLNGQVDKSIRENNNGLSELTNNDEATSISSTFSSQPREVLKRQETLLRAARRTREMLSVNSNVPVTVEGIHVPPVHQLHESNSETNELVSSSEGYSSTSFSTTLSRETFETECNHLFQQAIAIRDAAVQSTREWVLYKTLEFPSMQLNKHEIEMIKPDRIEVIGGATRMPRLLYLLEQPTNFSSATNEDEMDGSITKKYNQKNNNNNGTKQFEEAKREINIAHSNGYRVGRTLNADEAIVLGAANSASKSVQKEVYVLDKLTTNILFGLKNRMPSSNEEIQHEQENKAIHVSGKNANNNKTISEDLNKENVKEEMFTLFEAYKYILPSVKTIRLENRTNDLIFSLYEQEENKQEERRQLHANYADHLIRSYAITGVSEAVKAAKQLQTYERVVTRYNKTSNNTNATNDGDFSKNYYKLNRNMSLSNSFVVIETLVGENNMPKLNKAYLLSTYNVNGLINEVDEEELQKAELITEEEANLLNTKGNHGNMKAQTVNIDITNTTKDSDVNKQDMVKKVLYYEANGKLDFYNANEIDYVFPLHIEVIHHEDTNNINTNCGPVMSSLRKQQGQITVHEWQKVDFTRLHCSALRNQLEELLGETKFDVITLQTQIAQREAQRVTEWRSIIRTLVDWMEDESERATVHELEEQIVKVKSIKQQVRALEHQYEKE